MHTVLRQTQTSRLFFLAIPEMQPLLKAIGFRKCSPQIESQVFESFFNKPPNVEVF
jgi:hypothetical protein